MKIFEHISMPIILIILILLGLSSPVWAMSVTFIAPGHEHEAYWVGVSEVMNKAAQDLGIEFKTLFAERDILREIELVKSVTRLTKSQQPDYLIIAGEKAILPEQLKLAEAAQIPVFLIANIPNAQQRLQIGYPRERFKYWLGSLTPQAEAAGYMTGQALIKAGLQAGLQDASGRLSLLALSGTRSTGSSVQRNRGLASALKDFPQVDLKQVVHADWRQDKAYVQTTHLLQRYPDVRLIWCANDQIALGAMQALKDANLQPGKDVLLSAINTSVEAMQALVEGRLSALAGGHYLSGAWALVVLYDYHHGVDFAITEGLEMDRSMFALFSPEQAQRFIKAPLGYALDFRRYTKHLNPQLLHYRFDFRPILEDGQ